MLINTAAEFIDWFNKPLGYQAVSHYAKNRKSLLASLCDQHGSDKGSNDSQGRTYRWKPHTYVDVYGRLYDHCRDGVRAVFECGIGSNNVATPSNMGAAGRPGASLRVWRDYFPNARIVGADVDRDILFQEERIETHHLDQTDPQSIAALWKRLGDVRFDLMIDDGLHTFDAGWRLFEGSFQMLAPAGIYVIEDVKPPDLVLFRERFAGLQLNVEFINLLRPDAILDDNSLVVVRRT